MYFSIRFATAAIVMALVSCNNVISRSARTSEVKANAQFGMSQAKETFLPAEPDQCMIGFPYADLVSEPEGENHGFARVAEFFQGGSVVPSSTPQSPIETGSPELAVNSGDLPLPSPGETASVLRDDEANGSFGLTSNGSASSPVFDLTTHAGCLAYAQSVATTVGRAIHSSNQWWTYPWDRVIAIPGDAILVIEQRSGRRCARVPLTELTMPAVCSLANVIGTPIFRVGDVGLGTPRGNCGEKSVFTACVIGSRFRQPGISGVRVCRTRGTDHAYNQMVCNGQTYVIDSWNETAAACQGVVANGMCPDPGTVPSATGVDCSSEL